MAGNIDRTYEALCNWAKSQGIAVTHALLNPNKAGEFDGVSATMNESYPIEDRTYYLAHALGSIVGWSLRRANVQQMFHDLRTAKKEKEDHPGRFERALAQYRAFEMESSEFAVWLFKHLGHEYVIPEFTNFICADLEALTEFHRTGRAPVWRDYFDNWNKQVRDGNREIPSLMAKPIPAFEPNVIELQEILQEQPGSPE